MNPMRQTITTYLNFNYTLSDRTIKIYREHLDRLCVALDDPDISTVDHHQLARFMGSLKKLNGQPYAPSYLDQIHRSISTFFQFCVDEELIEKNPMKRLKRPRVETGPKPRLNFEQIKALLRQVKQTILVERNTAIVLLMVDSGLRLDEVARLRACDVRLSDGVVSVFTKKTSKWRDVPISELAARALANYLDTRPTFTSTKQSFFTVQSGEELTTGAIHLLLKRLQKRLKFPLHAHLLRHTFANTYIKKGELRKLQKILGHSRVDTTARFYTDPELSDIIAEHRQAAPTAQL